MQVSLCSLEGFEVAACLALGCHTGIPALALSSPLELSLLAIPSPTWQLIDAGLEIGEKLRAPIRGETKKQAKQARKKVEKAIRPVVKKYGKDVLESGLYGHFILAVFLYWRCSQYI